MKIKSLLVTIWKVSKIIYELYPIGVEIYKKYEGRSMTISDKRRKPLTEIKNKAKASGVIIGNTEAELIRSAIHYVTVKEGRR